MIDYKALFAQMHPGFFDRESIRCMPADEIMEEMVLALPGCALPCAPDAPASVSFGLYHGDMAPLHAAVGEVDPSWVQYFTPESRILCAYDGERIAAFCLIDDMGVFGGLRSGGPGCVGTVPRCRRRGIGLKMVEHATRILQREGFDLSYIHYTGVARWYEKLGYQTMLAWGAGGFLSDRS